MSYRIDSYQYRDSLAPAPAWLWPEHVAYGSDGSGRVVWWVHRAAEDAVAAASVQPADVLVTRPGEAFPTVAELFAKAAEFAVTLGLPPHLAITEALYWGLARDRFPDGVRVAD